MNKTRFLAWLKHHLHRHPTASPPLQDAIKKSAEWLQSMKPETDAQWQRLKETIESKRSPIYNHPEDIQRRFFRPAVSFAVAAVLIVVGGVLWLRNFTDKIYETVKGQHSTVLLQDSTEVTLNSRSQLIVSRWSLEKARRVSLKGEAYFHVKKMERPSLS